MSLPGRRGAENACRPGNAPPEPGRAPRRGGPLGTLKKSSSIWRMRPSSSLAGNRFTVDFPSRSQCDQRLSASAIRFLSPLKHGAPRRAFVEGRSPKWQENWSPFAGTDVACSPPYSGFDVRRRSCARLRHARQCGATSRTGSLALVRCAAIGSSGRRRIQSQLFRVELATMGRRRHSPQARTRALHRIRSFAVIRLPNP